MKNIPEDRFTYSLWQERDRIWFEGHPGERWRVRRAFTGEFEHDVRMVSAAPVLKSVSAPGKRLRVFVVEIDKGQRLRAPCAVDVEGRVWTLGDEGAPTLIDPVVESARLAVKYFGFKTPADQFSAVEHRDACFVCEKPLAAGFTAAYGAGGDYRNAHIKCATSKELGGWVFAGATFYSGGLEMEEALKALASCKEVTLFGHKLTPPNMPQ